MRSIAQTRNGATYRLVATLPACALAVALLASSNTPVSAQQESSAASSPAPAKIALVSSACVTVHMGDILTLNWNPGFEHPAMVANLLSVQLAFAGLAENGVTVRTRPAFTLGERIDPSASKPGVNGDFHTEFRLPRHIPPGEFHMIAAHIRPRMDPRFEGQPPIMTNSPVRELFCITVVPLPQPQSPPPPQPGG